MFVKRPMAFRNKTNRIALPSHPAATAAAAAAAAAASQSDAAGMMSVMAERVPFTYGEFYDVPRQILFCIGDVWYFLRSYFDDEKDDYAKVYDVYRLPFR